MTESRVFQFDELADADLIVDAIYKGGSAGNVGDDPISELLPVGNQGGFRVKGSLKDFDIRLCVLFTTGNDADWPDLLDRQTGRFVYFGDNKTPGHELHDTKPGGNRILRNSFDLAQNLGELVPPFFIFGQTSDGRDVRFLGLAVPGNPQVGPISGLVAVWRSTGGERFQNYRAVFTVLDVGVIDRAWLRDLEAGRPLSDNCPTACRGLDTGITPLSRRGGPSRTGVKPSRYRRMRRRWKCLQLFMNASATSPSRPNNSPSRSGAR